MSSCSKQGEQVSQARISGVCYRFGVLGIHMQSLLKPLALQHWPRGTSEPPFVARHTNALLKLVNLLVGSSSYKHITPPTYFKQ